MGYTTTPDGTEVWVDDSATGGFDSTDNVQSQLNSVGSTATPTAPATQTTNPYANLTPEQKAALGSIAGGGTGGDTTGTKTTDTSGVASGIADYFKRLFSGNASSADYMTGLAGLLALSQLKKNTTPLGYSGPGINMARTFTRTPNVTQPYTPYSGKPVMGQQYGTTTYAAKGGVMGLPRYLPGPTDGMADKIDTSIDGKQPAKLSHGEFVIPADVVSHLGNGNSDAGAQALYKMMDRVRKARTGTTRQGKQIDPTKFTPGGIAGYAGGGAVAFADGGTATGATISGESNLSSWAGPYVTNMLSQTQALTNSPYQAYTGPLTAGSSPLQEQAYQGYQNIQPYQGTQFNTGLGAVGSVQDYMNPYLQATLTPQLQAMQRQSDIAKQTEQAKYNSAGAFGGGRSAVAGALANEALQRNVGSTVGQAYQSAYDTALKQRMGEAQLGLTAQQQQEAANQFGANYGMQTLAAQRAAGAEQQATEQKGIDAAYQQWLTEQQYPYKQLQFQQSMLQGLPVSAYQQTNQADLLTQLLSSGTSLAALQKMLSGTTGTTDTTGTSTGVTKP